MPFMVSTTWPTTSPPARRRRLARRRQLVGLAGVVGVLAHGGRRAPPSTRRSLPARWPALRCAGTGRGCPGRSASMAVATPSAFWRTSATTCSRLSRMAASEAIRLLVSPGFRAMCTLRSPRATLSHQRGRLAGSAPSWRPMPRTMKKAKAMPNSRPPAIAAMLIARSAEKRATAASYSCLATCTCRPISASRCLSTSAYRGRMAAASRRLASARSPWRRAASVGRKACSP